MTMFNKTCVLRFLWCCCDRMRHVEIPEMIVRTVIIRCGGCWGSSGVSTQRSYPLKNPGSPAWRGRAYHIACFLFNQTQTNLHWPTMAPRLVWNTSEKHCWIYFWQWMLVLGQICYVGRCPLTEVWQDESLTLGFACWNTAPTQLNRKTQCKFNREDARTR